MASDTASDFAFPFGDPLASAERTGRTRSVSADLEEIFGKPAAPSARPLGAARITPRAEGAEAKGRRLSAASMGAIAAAALAGVAAGVLLVRSPPRAPTPVKPHPSALPVEMVAPTPTPQAADAALAAPVTPPAAASPPLAPQTAQAAPPRRAHSVSNAAAQSADRRLRAAYAHAIRAGVPQARLAEVRDRWAQARRRYAHDPARLASAYGGLTRDLDRAAGGPAHPHRARHRAPRHGLFHFLGWR